MTRILLKTDEWRVVDMVVRAWSSCSSRERLFLAMAGVLICFVVIFSTANWISDERHRLERAMPSRKVQLQQIQAAVAELEELRTRPAVSVSIGPDMPRIVAESARAHGIDLRIAGDGVALHVDGRAPFDRLIAWLGNLHKEFGLRVERLDLQRDVGSAVISATLAPAASQ